MDGRSVPVVGKMDGGGRSWWIIGTGSGIRRDRSGWDMGRFNGFSEQEKGSPGMPYLGTYLTIEAHLPR